MREKLRAVTPRIWLIFITLLAMELRFFRLGHQSLWFDEAFSWAVASADFKTSIEAILSDGNHPPLYYLVLGLFLHIGKSEEIIRLPSAMFGVLAVPLVYKIGRLCFGQKAGLISTLWFGLAPFHVWYSQEARMYAMVVFLSLGSVYFFLRTLRENDWKLWLGFVVFTTLAYLTAYSAFLVSLVQLAFIICTFRTHYRVLRRWTISQALAFLPTVPWLVALLSREVKSFGFGWIPRPGLLDPLKTLWNFSLGYTDTLTPLVSLSLLLFAFAFLHGLWDQCSGSEDDPPQIPLFPSARLFFALWLILPIAFVFLVSHLLVSIYSDRFLTVSLPPYIILVAYGITRIRKDVLRYGLAIAVLTVLAFHTQLIYFDPIFAKEDWRGAITYIESHAREGDLIVSRYIQDDLLLNYYYHGPIERAVMGTGPTTVPPPVLAQGHPRMWLIYRPPQESPRVITRHEPFRLEDERDPSVRAWLAANQGNLLAERNFPGVYVVLYRILPESEA